MMIIPRTEKISEKCTAGGVEFCGSINYRNEEEFIDLNENNMYRYLYNQSNQPN